MGRFLIGVLCLLIVSCGKPPVAGTLSGGSTPDVSAPPAAPSKVQPADILSYRQPVEAWKTSKASIFLIAGGSDSANFAQEIVDQRKLWLSKGFTDDDIRCYYAIPLEPAFRKDEAQYTALASDLKACFPAIPGLVWQDLRKASKNDTLDFLYLYVSSHGIDPPSIVLNKPKIPVGVRNFLISAINAVPAFDQYHVMLDVLPNATTAGLSERLQYAYDNGGPAPMYFFTPQYLKQSLQAFKIALPKYVVIQACHSGGFVKAGGKFAKDVIGGAKSLTALTASRADRASFGCDPGSERTAFGEAYGKALADNFAIPTQMDWDKVFSQAKEQVVDLEVKLNVEPSLPQFFTNMNERDPAPVLAPMPTPVPGPTLAEQVLPASPTADPAPDTAPTPPSDPKSPPEPTEPMEDPMAAWRAIGM